MDYKVLIVDDNDNNRFTLKSILNSIDIQIIEAKSGSETLEKLMKTQVDLIILDIHLPDYSGFDVAKMIKSRKSTMSIPIIFATAVFKSEEFILKGYELGAIDFILKPLNVDIIISKVKYYKTIELERKKLVEQLKTQNMKLELKNKELIKIQDMLSESVEDWRMLGENIPYNIEIYDKYGILLFSNKKNEEEKIEILHKLYKKKIEYQLELTLNGGQSIKNEHQVCNEGEVSYYELKSVYIHNVDNPRVLLIINDITKQKKHIDEIAYIGYHDQLTGLWNRHYFTEYVKTMKVADSIPITIIMSDVNGLKLINDGFGHLAGDELIKAAANCLRNCVSTDAVISRWGGDEFLILLPNTNRDEAQKIARNIVKEIEGEKIADKFPVSMALGNVTSYESNFILEDLIREAEDKMYINKMQNQASYRSFIVESLKSALYEQDYETKEHTERISKMALIIADHLKLSQNDKDKLVLLGSLHDIGKIGIPQKILVKNEKLSANEWNVIRKHPEIGYRICIAVPELSAIADLILSHHERWDGKGYPRKLKGTDIPLLARLIAIIDTFDVITHDRPYKKKQSHRSALEEIRKHSGTQFDPNLVHVFEHLYSEIVDGGETLDL